MLVTWIAPVVKGLPELAWLSELGRIEKIRDVVLVTRTGDVSLEDVATALREAGDVVIFSCHGIAGGLMLSDGRVIRSKWLAAQVSKCRPRVVILAACGSQDRDAGLHSLTEAICRAGINVIGFPAEASDNAAATFTIEFVRAAVAGVSVVEAFAVAMESIEGEETAQGIFYTPGAHDIPFSVEDRLKQIEQQLDAICKALSLPNNVQRDDQTTRQTGGIKPLAREVPVGHIQGIVRGAA